MEKIRLRDISERGLNVNDSISQTVFGLTEDDYLWLTKPITVLARLQKFDQTVLCNVEVCTSYTAKCYRSLEKVKRDWQATFSLDYEIEPHQEYLELEDDIRQEIILRLPMRVLSDAEIEKDKNNKQEAKPDTDAPPENTYQPFAGLKDIE